MKDLMKLFLDNIVAWTVLGVGIGIACYIFFTSRAGGKALMVVLIALTLAFCAMEPELMLSKASEILRWFVDHVTFNF